MDIAAATIALLVLPGPTPSAGGVEILVPPDASRRETFAAREVQRYAYLRTGGLLPIAPAGAEPAGDSILVARKGRPILARFAADPTTASAIAGLGAPAEPDGRHRTAQELRGAPPPTDRSLAGRRVET